LPTRVISVEDPPRLVVTNGRRGSWVSLSHCWGKGVKYVTTTSNLESSKSSLSIDRLTPTFQDAIAVTRELGFGFLWIDSICIIQDSVQDWHHEARRMQTYYKHAALTLAVDFACCDHEGFLSVSRMDDQTFARTSLRMGPAESACVGYIRHWADHTGKPRERSLLSTRAWTLQEDLLSPRSLHFTLEGLRWECQVHRISERDLRWYNILDEYCQRALTFGKDRLVALEGVAQEIAAQTGFSYVDGLWKEDLHFGLLWQVDARGVRPETERAPSWSWA
ncbi:HET-domain-containing protein, partial [Polychaeton citri CBS 116435]